MSDPTCRFKCGQWVGFWHGYGTEERTWLVGQVNKTAFGGFDGERLLYVYGQTAEHCFGRWVRETDVVPVCQICRQPKQKHPAGKCLFDAGNWKPE